MKTAPTFSALALTGALALTISSCLDNDEEITVRPNGSVTVQISARGKAKDLADGYPVPLEGPWVAENDATREWIRLLGADTGSAAVRGNLDALKGRSALLPDDKDIELRVTAPFPSVKDLPRFLAPESNAFRTPHLERSTDLRPAKKAGRSACTPAGQPRASDTEREVSTFEKELRETVRASFDRALQSVGTPTAARNAMRGELEWLFTAHDHTDDLGDDTLRFVVHMPGRVVSGNYDEADQGTASWKFGGDTIRDRDRVLRVVSVVE